MAWSWVRPADERLLERRPLLDLGCGDGQTVRALTSGGRIVGVDRSAEAPAADVLAVAIELPFAGRTFGAVLAADLIHHLADDAVPAVLGEILRVLKPGGRLVAWWYERPGRQMPGAPAHPRPYEPVAEMATAAGFAQVRPLRFEYRLRPSPATAGLEAGRPG